MAKKQKQSNTEKYIELQKKLIEYVTSDKVCMCTLDFAKDKTCKRIIKKMRKLEWKLK